ncbi:MAG: nucleotidyltransferase family protein [Verrucomicrobia bacterium]|nr:nucleotidyltransferase family protein [Verrucomicrobiota bacterium]MBS0636143.1 nucleotidyltransferase family protein [Verrucomicrobiota bacterium]
MLLKEAKKILIKHKTDLYSRGVRTLALFGSVARDEGKPRSDVDILVDYDAKKGLFAFVDLKKYLEQILKCDVDLVTKNALHPALKKTILQEAKNVF